MSLRLNVVTRPTCVAYASSNLVNPAGQLSSNPQTIFRRAHLDWINLHSNHTGIPRYPVAETHDPR